MPPLPLPLRSVVTTLRRYYGAPPRPVSRDPFRLILWEQVAYLVPDAQRHQAFKALREEVGLTPSDIEAASAATLVRIARLGGPIAAGVRAGRLRSSAERVMGRWDGHLAVALRGLPLAQARRALAQFAMIGEPGADKILVFGGRAHLLPLDSNGLRVLCRLGLTSEQRDYRATYRHAQASLAPVLPRTSAALVAAYYLLRRHGQELCRRKAPLCTRCPLQDRCPYGRAH